MSGNPHRLAEAANNINNHLNEAPKTSPQEDEFLTDLTKTQIAAISPLMKSKDWNKLKAYLVSQKMVDKDFNDIKGYKMDRDVLSVLQRSFKDYHEQTENNITNGLTENAVTESFASGKAEIKRQLAKEKGRKLGTGRPAGAGAPVHPDQQWGMKPVKLGAGRPAGAGAMQSAVTTAMKKFRSDFDELVHHNHHGAAALLLAKFVGHSRAAKCIELVNKIHEIEGSIPYPIQQYRDQWSQRLWADFDKNYPNERFQ